MKTYCPHCDEFTEFEYEPGDPEFAPKPSEDGFGMQYDSRGDDWYTCTKCQCSSSYKPKVPPPERTFSFPCQYCKEEAHYTWLKDDQWHDQEEHGWYSKVCGCEKQEGARYNLPDDPKKRNEYLDWQARGCPPPWWFRPLQLLVLTAIVASCILKPFWVFIAYLVLVYGLIGYEVLSGQISFVGSRRTQIIMGFIHWITAPLWFPWFFLIMAIRPPIL